MENDFATANEVVLAIKVGDLEMNESPITAEIDLDNGAIRCGNQWITADFDHRGAILLEWENGERSCLHNSRWSLPADSMRVIGYRLELQRIADQGTKSGL